VFLSSDQPANLRELTHAQATQSYKVRELSHGACLNSHKSIIDKSAGHEQNVSGEEQNS